MKIPVIKPDVKNPDTLRQQLVTIQDNINDALSRIGYDYSEVLDIKFYPEEMPKRIAHHLPRPCWGLKPVYFRNLTSDSTTPLDGIFVDWIPESGGIKIRSITGLSAMNLYQIRFIAYA